MDMQKNKNKMAAQLDQISTPAPGQVPPLQGSRINSMLRTQFSQQQDVNTVSEDKMRNKVTFKQPGEETAGPSESALGSRAGLRQSPKKEDEQTRAGRMLKTEEIREICENNGLERLQVYKIRSQYAAMVLMSKEDDERDHAELRAQNPDKAKKVAEEDAAAKMAFGSRSDCISLKFFKKNCQFLSGCLPDIVERILKAHGLDIDSPNTAIDWQRYLDLYCIFEAGKMDLKTLTRFWVKFFDINDIGKVEKEDYLRLLEKLVRGNALSKPNSTTKMFARMFQKMMLTAGVLNPETKEMDTSKLADAFEDQSLDIQMLGAALGSSKMDKKFTDLYGNEPMSEDEDGEESEEEEANI